MKRRNKQRYIKQINALIKFANGWPLGIIIEDRRPRYNEEYLYYKKWDSYCRTKKGRLEGAYADRFDLKPKRIALGFKNKNIKPKCTIWDGSLI